MKAEYLLFNIIILAGPLAMSFEPTLRFIKQWRIVLAAIVLSGVPYVVWDAAVANRHWFWNVNYTLGPRFLKMPFEEYLFFFTVPYACLFSREVIRKFLPNEQRQDFEWIRVLLFALVPVGIVVFRTGREYTGLMLSALGVVAFLDRQLRTDMLLQTRSYWYCLLVLVTTLIFNTYLTARPMLIYDNFYQLGYRIGTIPVEDFGYGLGHLILTAICYDWLHAKRTGLYPHRETLPSRMKSAL
jgi:lycopene cyclase domain-containing protein